MKLKKISAIILSVILVVSSLVGCGKEAKTGEPGKKNTSSDKKKLTMLIDTDITQKGLLEVIKLAEEKLGITIEMETRIGGSDGDNIVKTRLASGDMADLCVYNAGSLLQALNPAEYFLDISEEKFVDRLEDTFKETVTIDGATYGIPISSTQAGAVLYNKKIYKELGLEVPATWDEFLANCEVIKKAGKTAMIGTFGDSWTSQVMYLGDNYNVLADNPTFPEQFEAGAAKYATTPAGVQSFQKLVDVNPYYNEDYLAASYDDGCDMIANGEGAHWVMLTQSLSNIYELYGDKVNDIGVFGIPGEDPEDHGLTVWMPSCIYGNKNSENIEAVKEFMEFYVSEEALDVYSEEVLPDGPYCIKGYELPEKAYDAVKEDMQAYFDNEKTETALEFQTAVKGANCAGICQEVGSKQTTAAEAAKAYDEDCKKQAVQLGLGWK